MKFKSGMRLGHHTKIWPPRGQLGYKRPDFYKVSEAHFIILLWSLVNLERSKVKVNDAHIVKMVKSFLAVTDYSATGGPI